LLHNNLEHNGYTPWIKTVTEELGAEWLQKNLEHIDKTISATKTITEELGTKMLRTKRGTKWLQEDLQHNVCRRIWNTMVTAELRIN
jgi:hypothetical protein